MGAGITGALVAERSRAAALLSGDAADADPVRLTRGLLEIAVSRGARLYQGDAIAFDSSSQGGTVVLDNGFSIEARDVVLATGYVMPDIVRPKAQRPTSSWAIATTPQPQDLRPRQALIWEAQAIITIRTTHDGRFILGGEDDDALIEPDARDAATSHKVKALQEFLGALWPKASVEVAGWVRSLPPATGSL